MSVQDNTTFDLERAAWLLERLSRQFGKSLQRGELRRSLEESKAAWTHLDAGHWWKAFVQAADGQGLRARVTDCTIEELHELMLDGAWLIAPTQSYGFAAINQVSTSRIRAHVPSGTHSIAIGQFAAELGAVSSEGRYRCLVVVPQAALAPSDDRSPLSRLIGLLSPESGDIWTVIAFAAVAGVLALATPLAVESLVNSVAFGRLFQPVVILSLMLFGFLSFAAAIKVLQTFVIEILQRRLFARVANDIAYRLPRTPLESLDGMSGRELVNRFLEIVTVQKVAAQFLLDGISLILGTVIGMAVLAFYHPWLLGFDLILLALIITGIFILGRGAVATSIKESKTKYHTLAWLEELAGGAVTFRYGGANDFVLERTDRLTYAYLVARQKHFRILIRQIAFALGIQALASTVLLGLGGWLVINQQLSLGQLVASELIVATIVGAFAKFGKHMESFYDLMAAIDKLGSLFDLPIENQSGLLSFPNNQPAEVDVDDVSYHWAEGGSALNHVSLHLESGARAVLRGESGSGKSLLLDLLFGSRRNSTGHITMNGIDPRDFRPDVLRRCVALVRHVEVFEGTIAENIHLGRSEISSANVRTALSEVGLLDDVLRMPEGMQSVISTEGAPLSSNQLRRLMLAKAIVGQPRLLLIDGLLDALPDTGARDIMTMLCRQDQPWTLLIVTGHEMLRQGLRQIHIARNSEHLSTETETSDHVG